MSPTPRLWTGVRGAARRGPRPVPAGASLLRTGERLERIFRDLAVGNAHRNTSLRDWAYRELALAHFGLPSQSDMLQRRPSVRSQEPTA